MWDSISPIQTAHTLHDHLSHPDLKVASAHTVKSIRFSIPQAGLLTFAPLGPSNRSRYTTGKAAELCLNSQNCKLHHRCCRLDVMCLLRVHMQSLDSPGSWYKDTLWPFKVRIQGEVIMQVLQGYY